MSDLIQLLPDAIADQIAAGEVIQRPASVLKELMENAIDAGAKRIKVIIRDAGKTMIQVIDDGLGMSETDARMSIERHATSKIRTADDLFAISTMGFRGEALASIVAISHVELKTRREDDTLGTRLVVNGSEVQTQEPCQSSVGTSVSVKNLFFNVPARRKFLKSDTVELRHLVDEFTHVALAFPGIEFSMHHNEKELFILPAGKLRQRIVGIIGKRCNEKIVPIHEETNYVNITGFVGKPDFARKTRGEQYLFVNRRFVKSPYLNHAIRTAFEDLIPSDQYPFYALFLDLDPAIVDINVHPTKQEIKFEDERLVYNYVRVAVRHGLGKYSITPSLDFDQEAAFSGNRPQPGVGFAAGRSEMDQLTKQNLEHWEKIFHGLEHFKVDQGDSTDQIFTLESKASGETEDDLIRLGGTDAQVKLPPLQLHRQFLISQIKSGMLIIDQQSAHERILYEQFLQLRKDQGVQTQKALFPVSLDLSPGDAALMDDILEDVRQAGFDIQHFGGESYVIHGTPAQLGDSDPLQIVQDILHRIKNNLDPKLETGERIAKAMAISGAIHRGRVLNEEERQLLIDKLFGCENPYTSPSGRKCFITIELDDLSKRFST